MLKFRFNYRDSGEKSQKFQYKFGFKIRDSVQWGKKSFIPVI